MTKLGYILLALSAPFFLETSFEMYVLTALSGPQMLGFSLMHSGGTALLVVLAVSALSFLFLAIYSLVAFGRVLLHKPTGRHERVFVWILGVQVLHVTLFFLYDYWSRVFSHVAS